MTARVKEAASQASQRAGRPIQYLNNGMISKEELARQVAKRDKIKEVIDQGKRALGELCMPVSQDELPSEIRGQPGVYVFYGPRGNALYVRRTRDLFERIPQHSRPSKKDAPFAWLLAREETGHPAQPIERKAGARHC